ncbi:hypothetical protein BDN71DRAFT_1192510 [Pleurotus eryngii]|uniref:Protein-S-isoprenylcysteine O-methyltransferase n=1 Tax=Pleurotus eryngii TaxID=5323 RepID=A0A9P6A6Y9_PLEER|nr:hypothetical protein BDN71DRAFT_1192510 [Pleurotus eryngii]
MDRILTLNNALAAATAVSYYKSLTPPNIPVARNELMVKNWFERTIQARATLDKVIVCTMSAMEIATTLHLFGDHGSCLASLTPSTTPSTTAIVGASVSVFAALLRLWCFGELGNLFDFEFRIKADHRLISSGPYSYVRHPSYTGLFASYIGATIFIYSPGHWLRECGSSDIVGLMVTCVWFFDLVICFYGVGKRLRSEDEGLRRRFGKEWEEFARRVPHRLIPGIY